MTYTEACVALNMIPAMGPVRLRKLLEVFETPERILEAGQKDLRAVPGIGEEVAANLTGWRNLVDLDAELEAVEKFGARVVTSKDADYPRLLREIHDPPIVLYTWGSLEERDQHALGVVGSRKTTHYGLECAKKLSYQIAYAGLTVVSGLARGIDTASHQGALAARGRTIAVIGAGLNHIYPSENLPLAEKICDSGAVVSEFPMDTKPDRQTFPMRNRIISGWSFGVLVVEAGLGSGALITATQAADQGRSVYAVPGQINRPSARGTNRLIQQGAKLVSGANDILQDMQMLFVEPPELERSTPAVSLKDDEQKVLDTIGDSETSIDRIISKSRLPSGVVSSTLLSLEMKRLVKQLPGQRFVRLL